MVGGEGILDLFANEAPILNVITIGIKGKVNISKVIISKVTISKVIVNKVLISKVILSKVITSYVLISIVIGSISHKEATLTK